MKPNLVIIGNGMAGIRTLEVLLSAAPDHYRITVIGKEPFGSYNRIMLSPVLAGESHFDEILIHDRNWYEEQGIELLAGEGFEATVIDRVRQQVQCRNGQRIAYDRLLIAIGSEPLRLPIPGANSQGVMGFRGIRDVEQMQRLAVGGGQAVVIGAGLLGLEAAHGLNQLGMVVTVIHRARFPLNRQLDAEAATLLQQTLEARGIQFRLGVNSRQVLDSGHSEDGWVSGLELDSGERLPARLIVMATGITPNIELASNSGLACNKGILVNDCLQTFDPKIYAVGECVEHRNLTFGLVEPLFEQAKVCANHLAAHGVASYSYLKPATRLKISGIKLFSMGDFDSQAADVTPIHYRDPAQGIYKKLLIRNNLLIGAVLYGDTADGPWYHELMREGRDLAPYRDGLIFGRPPETAATASTTGAA
ncbi:MAG: nitrite reductase (NADH) large subunit [Motiliproteus sp.]|jgi:nitrite reductase (NADH) large subunit